ncbi:DNA translocase FtsK 4TM domain-containing protein, partial [Bacteroidota bacterium]
MARNTYSPKNTFKSETSKEKKKKPLKLSFPPEKRDRIRKIVGLTLLTFSVFLTYAFTSFLFNWKFDQDLVKDLHSVILSFKDLKPDLAENGTGLIGAYFSHLFMCRWFGVSSYLFILLFFILGFKLFFDYSLLPIKRTIIITLFAIFWLSSSLGLLLNNSADLVAGGFGVYSQLWLCSILGVFGAAVLLI